MCRVQAYRIKSGRLAPPCRIREFPDKVNNILCAHLADRFAFRLFVFIKYFMALGPRHAHDHIAGGIYGIAGHSPLPSRMLELDAGFCAVTLDSLCQPVQAGNQLVSICRRAVNGRFPRFHFRSSRAYNNKPRATFCKLGMVIYVPFACLPIGVRRTDIRRDMANAVGYHHIPDLDWFKQVLVILFHLKIPFILNRSYLGFYALDFLY